MNCVQSVSFSLNINGSAEGWFTPSRGVRQGDPLSPYLFNLCMEPLIRHLKILSDNPKSHVGVLSSPRGLRICNLVFADDCLIFGKASSTTRNIKKVLDAFSSASGHQINLHKSICYFSSNVHRTIKEDICSLLGIPRKHHIGKYLGIHNIVFWKDPVNASELLLKLQNKLAGWKAATLSRGGKLTLLKSNLSGMPNHTLSCFKCPTKLTNKFDSECRRFFWGSSASHPPVA